MAFAEPTVTSDLRDKRFGQAMMLFGIACFLMLTLGAGVQAINARVGLAVTLLFVILLPAVLFARWKKAPLRDALRLRPISPAIMATSLLAGVGGWGIAAGAGILIQKLGIQSIPVEALIVDSIGMLLVMLFVGAVMPGVCEECLFRGAIQGVLERRGKWFGIIIAGVLFGLFHMDPTRMLIAPLLGIFAGWLVVRTGSLFPAMLSHFGNNATAITVGYLFQESEQQNVLYWLLPSLAVLWVVATLFFAHCTNSPEFKDSVKPSTLTSVSAGLSPGVAWGCGIPGTLFGVLVIAGTTALTFLLTSAKVDDDALSPKVREGDRLMLMKPNSPLFDLDNGDIVVFKQGDKTLARTVARHEEDRVWVSDPSGTETELKLTDIVGSLIPGTTPQRH